MDNNKVIVEVDDIDFIEDKSNKQIIRILSFSLNKETYCIHINQAKEVIRVPDLTRVPNTPEFILGVINLRGEIIALIDLHYFFGLERKEENLSQKRVIVTDVKGQSLGILVDNIEEAEDIEESLIQKPLATLNEKIMSYTKGHIKLEDRILIFLDLEKVLTCEEINKLREGGQ